MKNVKITTVSGTQVIEQGFNIHSQTGLKKVLGTALNRIFQFNDLLRAVKSDSFIRANADLNIIIEVDGVTEIDTVKLNESINAVLRFGPSAASKKQFAQNLHKLVQWATSDVKIVDIETLIDSLEG